MSDDKRENTLRRLLGAAQIDQRMMARFDLFNELRAAMKRKDKAAQLEIARKLKLNGQEIIAEKARAAAAIAAAFEDAKATADPDERTAKLLKAFELSVKTKYWAYQALGDIDAGNAAAEQTFAIVAALDAIPPGRRAALDVFLDSSDVGVRCVAASRLKKIMPDRAIPILRQIDKEEGGSSVGFTAMQALWPDTKSETPEGKGGAAKS